MTAPHEWSFRLTAEALEEIRAAVGDHVRPLFSKPNTVDSIVLAIDEALQNVLRHGYGGTGGEVRLTVRREADEMIFEIRDFAPPADHDKIKPRPLDAVRPGGLGTHLIRSIMDQVDYSYPPDGPGNLLILKKKIGHGRAQD